MINPLSINDLQKSDLPRAETAETAKTPASVPGHVRLMLGQRASEALTATGEAAFVVIGKASLPDDPTRWVIHLLPLTMKTACDAIAVATGEARATRSRVKGPATTEKPATLTTGGNAGESDG